MIKVVFYGWKIDSAIENLIAKMSSALIDYVAAAAHEKDKPVRDIDISTIDTAVYGEVSHDEGYGLVFGKAIKQVVDNNGKLFGLPDTELLTSKDRTMYGAYRIGANETIKTVAKFISQDKQPAPTTVALRQNNVTVGKEATDIVISEEALRYIKELRELLGGGAVEITKGDLRILIKEKENGNN